MGQESRIAALLRHQQAAELRREEAETDDDYLQDGASAKAVSKFEGTPPSTTSKSAPSAGDRDRIHTSVYLPRDLRRRLREIAAKEDCKAHDLILEGIRHVVDGRTKTPLERR